MTADKFWSGWLKTTMIMIILGGIALVVLYNFGMAGFLDKKMDRVFFNGHFPGLEVTHLRSWMISITGSVMAAWGLSMLYLVIHVFPKKEAWAWRSMFYPLLIWYLIDTSVSLRYGVGFNAILNTVLFLQVMAPLLFLRNEFLGKIK